MSPIEPNSSPPWSRAARYVGTAVLLLIVAALPSWFDPSRPLRSLVRNLGPQRFLELIAPVTRSAITVMQLVLGSVMGVLHNVVVNGIYYFAFLVVPVLASFRILVQYVLAKIRLQELFPDDPMVAAP